ncbi:MAG TPA: MGMT family protein [Mycobacteriales bacterium]|nr:MGMT family protein [Mycobacteriales bacterium]
MTPGGNPAEAEPDGRDDFSEAVLDVVAAIPAGRVLSYGDVAEYLAGEHPRGGARAVGRVLATRGSGVPWWRVLRADGSVVPVLRERALTAYRAEGTPLLRGGSRVDMARARWDG